MPTREEAIYLQHRITLWLAEGMRAATIMHKLNTAATPRIKRPTEADISVAFADRIFLRKVEMRAPEKLKQEIQRLSVSLEHRKTYPRIAQKRRQLIWDACNEYTEQSPYFFDALVWTQERLRVINRCAAPIIPRHVLTAILTDLWGFLFPAYDYCAQGEDVAI